jgi:hypothetical protein
MRSAWLLLGLLSMTACRRQDAVQATAYPSEAARLEAAAHHGADAVFKPSGKTAAGEYVGFDRNLYPGDQRLAELHKSFAYAGFWLNDPPGETSNSWAGKRMLLRRAGFGFLVLANGRLDAEINRSKLKPAALGIQDAVSAVASAKQEGFPANTLIFLDQEEGGRLLPEQAEYFFAWTEAVSDSEFRAGAYLSGQASPDGTGLDGRPLMVTTAEDVRQHIAAEHLHPVVFWVQQDACPPAPGCTLAAPLLKDSGTEDAPVWQYSQTPRRPELTRACAATYAQDGSCYAGATRDLFVDLNVAASPDPSAGR